MSQKTSLPGEAWRFTVRPGQAQRVYLVVDGDQMPSRWIEMQPVPAEAGLWDVETRLVPDHYRMRYFIAENGTFLNCGSAGLEGTCLSTAPSQVIVEAVVHAKSA